MSRPPVSTNSAPEVSITIRATGETLSGWSNFTVVTAIDAAANAFAFSAPFDPTPANQRRFRPYSPGVIDIKVGSAIFLTGYMEKIVPTSSRRGRDVRVEGRSASGAIMDWSAGARWSRSQARFLDETVFEISGVTAGQIADLLAAPYSVSFVPDTGHIADLSIEPGKTVFQVLGDLASTNGYFGVPQPNGSLVFRNDLGSTPPVMDLVDGEGPVASVGTGHDTTKRFSRYRAISAASGVPSVAADSVDPELAPAIRGIRILQPDQPTADIQKTADNARSRSLIESYRATLKVDGYGYNTPNGAWSTWRAGDVITLLAPAAMIYRKTRFIVKRATFSTSAAEGQTTTLDLTLPELYAGGYPEVLPWVA